jgi:hypothetical protein
MNADCGLQVEVVWWDEDMLELYVSARNGIFAGAAMFFAGFEQLDDFATALSGFPNDFRDTRQVVLGDSGELFGDAYNMGTCEAQFFCVGRLAQAWTEVKIKSKTGDQVQQATLSFRVEAAAIDAFVAELRQLNSEKTGSACMRGFNGR